MNLNTEHLEYTEIDGIKMLSIVRTNLMNREGYAPYCGSSYTANHCSMPRTKWNGEQFYCPECGFVTEFPKDFIRRYKKLWNK